MFLTFCGLLWLSAVCADPEPSFGFNFQNLKGDIYEQPVNLMSPKKVPHMKGEELDRGAEPWAPYDITGKAEELADDAPEHNRLKRRAKRRRPRVQRRQGQTNTAAPVKEGNASATSEVPVARRSRRKKQKKPLYDTWAGPDLRKTEDGKYVEMPKDLYQAHLRPGVIFRIHMSEAILKMQYRNYGEDKDESVIEADVEYLRLTRKVINDEITKFEDLRWLVGWFRNRSLLVTEHACNTRYLVVGIPPTIWTHPEEYMKRMCLFDNVYLDHIPYVVGEDQSLMAAVAPPVLHCDASTCTSVPFIDSVMFDEKLARSNVRTTTRCQASCRAHCRNDADCLKRCSDRCLRAE
ncbi:uncharacterized protein LOC125239876 isoform X1 [Leguminivora glycinivorella]|uniref:uncharacterized protein LOC125239876 isoform X1 n=2 Tax=Leguminivora glycinivorella TaxID=1035111 RepID=UPI00200D2A80|nr:uncharacterized protein LOC125239876 isoform X1 [Leguminivora glycinivorella]